MAQTAVSAIRSTCQFLSEGRQELGKLKTQITTGVADAKAIYAEFTGLWGWLQGLFKFTKPEVKYTKPEVTLIDEGNTPKLKSKAKREPEPELSYEEFQARAVHDICENLKVYFEAVRQLKIYCRKLKEEALITDKVADSAIDRIEIEWQMKQLSAQLRQSMIYGTPESLGLGALYQEFLIKQNEIVEEQEVARTLKAKKERDTAWQHEHRNEILIAKLSYGVIVAIVMLELIGLYLAL
jgi:hypothetical protein